MLFCIVSRRPRGMRTTLLNALDRAAVEGVEAGALVVDASGDADAAANAQALRALAGEFDAPVYHAREARGKALAAREFGAGAAQAVFRGRFGGARNLALLAALALDESAGENAVFFDDDCVPVENCVSLYARFFGEGKKIVAGAYAGKNTGVDSLLAKIQNALSAFADGAVSREFAAARVEEALRGISDDYETTGAGYRGGNIGVSLEAARAACFAPTSFRVEDALYCKTARFFLGVDALFEPAAPSETPTVFHKPLPGALSALRENWVDAVRGASVALSVNFILENGFEPTVANVERACREAPARLLAQFDAGEVSARREKQVVFNDAVKKLGSPQLEEECFRISALSREDVELPRAQIAAEVAAFFAAREAWLKIAGIVEKTGALKKEMKDLRV